MKNLAVAVCLGLCAMPAFACNHPGTPNPVTAYPINATTIELLVTNTAKEGDTHLIVFEIEDTQGHVVRYGAKTIYGEALPWDIGGLAPNTTHTYRVWTRDDNSQGCRSEKPSGWVTATTSKPYQPQEYPPGDSGPCKMGPNGCIENLPVGVCRSANCR